MATEIDETMAQEMQHKVEQAMLDRRYGDPTSLGNEWVRLRKKADEAQKGTPEHSRAVIVADQARLAYDMAYMLQRHKILQQQVEMLSEIHYRLAILEGAYSHLMLVAHKNNFAPFGLGGTVKGGE